MLANSTNIFGFIGSFLVSINLIPQIYKMIMKKSGKDISYFSLFLNILASLFMLAYAFESKLYPVIISNTIILLSSVIIIGLKKYFNFLLKNLDTNIEIDVETGAENCTNENTHS